VLKRLTIAIYTIFTLLLSLGVALADPCDVTSGTDFIEHDLTLNPTTSNSYCELCGTGYITIVVSNPYGDDTFPYNDITNMTNMTVVENLGASGLTYAGDIWINGTLIIGSGSDPVETGANDEILTWTSSEIAALGNLAGNPNPSVATNITIRFSVERVSDPEGLADALLNRDITADLTYTAVDNNTGIPCTGGSATASDTDTLPLREPNPTVTKLGRNMDAGQGVGDYATQVYGNIDDDIIWRIQVDNSAGTADLQDLRLDDIMDVGSLNITDLRFICGSEGDAATVAGANSVDPGGLCVPFPPTWGGARFEIMMWIFPLRVPLRWMRPPEDPAISIWWARSPTRPTAPAQMTGTTLSLMSGGAAILRRLPVTSAPPPSAPPRDRPRAP